MDSNMDIDGDRRPRSGSYGSHNNASRLPSADSSLHNYHSYTPSGSTTLPGPPPPSTYQQPSHVPSTYNSQHSGWNPPPSPYVHPDQRGPPESAPHSGQHNSAAYGTNQRPYPSHPVEPSYSRQGSTSAPSRSPIETPRQSHHAHVNGHEGPHSNHSMPPVPSEPGARHGYVPHETQGSGNQPHGLPSFSGTSEVMSHPATAPPGPPPYVPHSAAPPSAAQPYDQASYPYAIQNYATHQARRKPVRASQACDTCRARKAKCDEGRPCSHCRDNNLECQYRELPIPKQDRYVREQIDKLDQILRRLDSHEETLSEIKRTLHLPQSEQKVALSASTYSTPSQSAHQPDAVYDSKERAQTTPSELPPQRHDRIDRQSSQPIIPPENRSGELTIPLQHSTYAHKLLEWPVIKSHLDRTDFTQHYVNNLEQCRPVIRPYGRGAGEEKNDPGKGPSSPADSSTSSSRSDDQDVSPSPNGPWGQCLRYPLPLIDGPDHPGGQKANGFLNLDEAMIDKYFQSYLNHLHNLHPFLNRRMLGGMINRFKKRYSLDKGLSVADRNMAATSKKRKHGEDATSPYNGSLTRLDTYDRRSSRDEDENPEKKRRLEHSLSNAIILLVLALGKICMSESKLPGPVADAYPSPSSNPSQASPPSSVGHRTAGYRNSPDYQGMTVLDSSNHQTVERSSTASAHTTTSVERKRNLDVIPGLAYYSVAINIIGEHLGENCIEEVQACILAGLYAGQLAHVAQSHKWIGLACNACQILVAAEIRRKDSAAEPSNARNTAEALKFAYWTCLQLESDILAEIDLPPSGITRYEGWMYDPDNNQMPKGYVNEDQVSRGDFNEEDDLIFYYSSQIHLRIKLNSVHKQLYDTDTTQNTQNINFKALSATVAALDDELVKWRKTVGFYGTMGWEDCSFQSDDTNTARMRAKFYGGRYIIHRPILNHILHYPHLISENKVDMHASPISTPGRSSVEASPAAVHSSGPPTTKRTLSQMGPPSSRGGIDSLSESERSELQEKFKDQCRTCIEAAKKSTEVFDAIKGRLVVTNIFGTAHAQFGNMLVLSVTYLSRHPFLGKLIGLEELKRLLDRTISFLRRYDETSPTLKVDAEILTYIRDKYLNSSSHGTPNVSLPSMSPALSTPT